MGLAAAIEAYDWAATPIGPREGWPAALTTLVDMMVAARFPMFVLWGPQHVMLYNDGYVPILGARHPAALGRSCRAVWPEVWDDVGPLIDRAYAGESSYLERLPLTVERNGFPEQASFTFSYSPITSAGRVEGMFCAAIETTAIDETEAKLMRSRERLELANRAANDAVWDWDLPADKVRWNDALTTVFGHARDAVVPTGAWWLDNIHPDDRHRIGTSIHAAIEGNANRWEAEYRFRRADGGYAYVLDRGYLARDARGRAVRMVGAMLDLSERRRADRTLADLALKVAAREEELRAITDSVDQMIWATQPDGFHDYYNQRWYDYTGVPEGSTDGEAWNGMFHPDDQDRAWATWRHSLATGEPYHIEYRLRHRSGAYRWVLGRAQPARDADGKIVRWFGTCTDIQELIDAREIARRASDDLERQVASRTADLAAALDRLRDEVAQRELAEEALRQAQKMEAVGQLTGGIAHDFNNLLTIISGNIDMIGRRLGDEADPRLKRAAANALKGAERAAALTQRLLAFSRRQPLQPRPTDINRLLTGMADLLARALGETVKLETVTGAGLWRVDIDPNQLENAVLNLSVNARDAMPGGGRLTIETSNVTIDRAYAQSHPGVAAGSYVLLAVSDTGSGMDADTAERAFDPFFTTKEVGRGTGLGLSMVYGFVKQSGGHVKIYSEPGEGTTVRIYLPRLLHARETDEPAAAPDERRDGRAETVLVVEDDADVRSFTSETLRDLGYRVIEAGDGPAALRRLERAAEADAAPVALLVTDVVMPGMTGRELADHARARQPSIRVLFVSGYPRNAIVHGGRLDPGVEFLAKPFTVAALSRRVRDVLDAHAAGPLLLGDEDAARRRETAAMLGEGHIAPTTAATPRELSDLARASAGRFEAVLLSAGLACAAGVDALVAELHGARADLPVLILADPAEAAAIAPRVAGQRCVAVLARPFDLAGLRAALAALAGRCHEDDDRGERGA